MLTAEFVLLTLGQASNPNVAQSSKTKIFEAK